MIDLPKDYIQKPDDILALIEKINIKCISLYEAITSTEIKNDDIDIIITKNVNEIKNEIYGNISCYYKLFSI